VYILRKLKSLKLGIIVKKILLNDECICQCLSSF